MSSLSSTEIETILMDALPDECDLVGETHVASVASQAAGGHTVQLQAPSRAGLRMSPEAAMLAVAAAANFIKVCIEIYFSLKKAKGTAPPQSEFAAKTATQAAALGESGAKLTAAVYRALCSA